MVARTEKKEVRPDKKDIRTRDNEKNCLWKFSLRTALAAARQKPKKFIFHQQSKKKNSFELPQRVRLLLNIHSDFSFSLCTTFFTVL